MMYEMPRPNQPDVFLRYDFGPVADFWYLHYICVYIPSRFSGEAAGCTPESTRLSDFAIFTPFRIGTSIRTFFNSTNRRRNTRARGVSPFRKIVQFLFWNRSANRVRCTRPSRTSPRSCRCCRW